MENPYRDYSEPAASPESSALPAPPRSRLVAQVRVLAILMIAQGVLEILAGVLLGCMGVVFPLIEAAAEQAGQQAPHSGAFTSFMLFFYLALGAAHLAAGVLHVVAAARNYRYRGRKLGITALIVGLVTASMMICLPTALALAVYGLIVYVNEAVVRAFDLGEQGESAEAILASCG
jgi:hypothetical protein